MKLGKTIAVAGLVAGLALLPSGASASGKGNGPKKEGCQHHCYNGGGGGNGQNQSQNQNQEQNQNQDQEQSQCFIVLGVLEPASC